MQHIIENLLKLSDEHKTSYMNGHGWKSDDGIIFDVDTEVVPPLPRLEPKEEIKEETRKRRVKREASDGSLARVKRERGSFGNTKEVPIELE